MSGNAAFCYVMGAVWVGMAAGVLMGQKNSTRRLWAATGLMTVGAGLTTLGFFIP